MKVTHKPPDDEVRERRKKAYLEKYPVETQLEAITEYAQGRPDKLNELVNGLSEIRKFLPFCGGESV